jgi:hypothetical protein
MDKLTDAEIRKWIKAGRFEGKAVGGGLHPRFREGDKTATWRFRYRFDGKQRIMSLGSYGDVLLAEATREAKRLSARVGLGHDVAGEKQERKLWLSADELVKLFAAMRQATGFSVENGLTIKLLLLLAVRNAA